MKKFIIIAAIIVGIASCSKAYDVSFENDINYLTNDYCTMVDIHKMSNGDNGWPDFKDIYEEDCK